MTATALSSPRLVKDVIQWDVGSWKRALDFWEPFTGELSGAKVLEIGSRGGGLSLYFALKGARVVCSDVGGPQEEARELHARYGVTDLVDYQDVDALAIDFPDESFDLVCFKSVLGALGRNGNYAGQRRAVEEMRRVLRPGGKLLFAENMAASSLHRYFRDRFVSWGRSWRYVSAVELEELFGGFKSLALGYYGFFAAFGRGEGQRRLLHVLDVVAGPVVPKRSRYIVFGCATK